MGKTDSHHLFQQATQKKLFGTVIDNRTVELPERYHEKKINPTQKNGVGDAYLAGLIDHDIATGEIDDYEDDD